MQGGMAKSLANYLGTWRRGASIRHGGIFAGSYGRGHSIATRNLFPSQLRRNPWRLSLGKCARSRTPQILGLFLGDGWLPCLE